MLTRRCVLRLLPPVAVFKRLNCGTGEFSSNHRMNYRFTEWLGLEGTSKIIYFNPQIIKFQQKMGLRPTVLEERLAQNLSSATWKTNTIFVLKLCPDFSF